MSAINRPLTEFDLLNTFLAGIDPPAMNLEELDGYFAALVCCPDNIAPSEYLPAVWGKDFAFEDNAQATEILELLMRHWNAIADALHRTLEVNDVYLPVLLENEDGIAHGNEWAEGFMRGIAMRPAAWQELLDDDEHGGLLVPMMVLAHEHDPDPEMRPNPIAPEKRDDILQAMIAGLTGIYRHLEPQRRAFAATLRDQSARSYRRSAPKVGRNDPCPCGSGRKYKHCCGANPTLH